MTFFYDAYSPILHQLSVVTTYSSSALINTKHVLMSEVCSKWNLDEDWKSWVFCVLFVCIFAFAFAWFGFMNGKTKQNRKCSKCATMSILTSVDHSALTNKGGLTGTLLIGVSACL